MRGNEILRYVDFNSIPNVGLQVVKVRRIQDLIAALGMIDLKWNYVITRSSGENRGLTSDAITEAFNYRQEFIAQGRLDRWLAHIPANEPNSPEYDSDCSKASTYQTNFGNLTGSIRDWTNATGIMDIPWTTPPLTPWHCEDEYINAMKNAMVNGIPALGLTDQWGNAIWRKYGCHHYWNNCGEVRYRYEQGMYKYADDANGLYSFAPKMIIVDECNSNPPCKGGQYGGYADSRRLADVKLFVKLTEGNVLYNTASKVEAIVVFARATSPSCWYNFDFDDGQWSDFANFDIYSYPDQC